MIKLYKHVGIEFRRANYSYSLSKLSFASGKGKLDTSVLYNGNSGLAGISMPSDMQDTNDDPSCSNVSYIITRMTFLASSLVLLLNYMRVVILACPLFQSRDTSFGAWIEENCPQNLLARFLGFDESWKHLCYDILLPLFSGICTASREEMLSHPVLDFLGTMSLLSFFMSKMFYPSPSFPTVRLYLGWLVRTSLRCSQQCARRRRSLVQAHSLYTYELRHYIHVSR